MPQSRRAKSRDELPSVGRHRALLSHPLIQPWYESRSLRSRLSADQYVRQLGLQLERTGLDPQGILALAKKDPDKLRDLLVRDAARLKREGWLDSSISKFTDVLKAFLKFHRVPFDGYPSLRPIRAASLSLERVPTPDELGRILERLSLRGRVIALLHAHAGIRPGVLGSYGGEAGLTLGDLPELKIGRESEFGEIPLVIRVPADLSKTRVAYITFGTQQLATALLAYLGARQDGGEKLGPTSPVIAAGIMRGVAAESRANAKFSRGFLSTKSIEDELRSVIHAMVPEGVTWRPYVLRSYCSTRLLIAEGQGKISRDLREAILGHDGGVASRYNVGKRWGSELLTEARREYANAAEFLETNAQSRVNVAAEFRRTLLGVAGMSEEEAAKHVNDSNDELLAILREKLTGRDAAPTPPSSGSGNGHGVQKPVTLEEAEFLLAEGWTYVANFGPNRVLLQAPTWSQSPSGPAVTR
jgi:hypothetical protein